MSELLVAIQITIIGMSLIFALLLLTWGMAALLVKLTSKPPALEEASASNENKLKHMAAVAAVAAALADVQVEELHEFPLPPTATVSPWQAVMRSKILNRESTRKR